MDARVDTGIVSDGGGGTAHAFTPQELFTIEYIAPPAALSDYVTTLYFYRCDETEIRDIQPAAIGHLAIFAKGDGVIRFRDGSADNSHLTNLLTPFSVAAPFQVSGPFHAFGAALTPLGWAALTGLDAGKHGNRLYRAADWLSDEVEVLGRSLRSNYLAGTHSGVECAMSVGEFILSNISPINPRHADLIKMTNQWLGSAINPELAHLMEQAAYSERQVQRLVERYFGLPPQALARKYRALRAAALMSFPMLTAEYEAELGEAFYDQSHMIREIQLFVGRTPARLSDAESPYLTEMLDLKNFRELGG